MTYEEKIKKIQELTDLLNIASSLYDKGFPTLSDEEWDKAYFKLQRLEKEVGEFKPNSPTQSIPFTFVTELKKVKHNHYMLSLDKTKDINVIKSFIGEKKWVAMAKMDGLTCSLRYLNGKLVSAETRGNGVEGEDVTHNAMVIPSIPKEIEYKSELIVDGEIICTYKNFKNFSDTYRNPRNFASGSIRLLNSKECAERGLTFVAWDVIKGFIDKQTLTEKIIELRQYNFITVPITIENDITPTIEEAIDQLKTFSQLHSFPIDGIVFKYDNIKEYNAAGRTDHHFKGGLCLKFYDETYSTKLRTIEWSMGRTGILTPVAVFEPVNIDGTEVTRASLHNVSVMRDILGECAYVGEPLEVYKSNMIIPQIYSAGPKMTYKEVKANGGKAANDVIDRCPICGEYLSVIHENEIERVYCNNPQCTGKLVNRLDYFCSKKGLDIKGLSKATLEKLIEWNWLLTIEDLFKLSQYRATWINKTGFGPASVDKILNAIDVAKECTPAQFLTALGIPYVGKVASEALMKKFKTYNNFREAVKNKSSELYNIAGIGEVMIENLLKYNYSEADSIFEHYIKEKIVEKTTNDLLKDKVFCITGKTKLYKNRDELAEVIKSYGGKVASSVTSKTTYLINNDTTSTSSKNTTAKKLNVPIINEEEFKTLITPPNEKIEPSYLASAT